MKNLLVKILFISLLTPVVTPSGVHAGVDEMFAKKVLGVVTGVAIELATKKRMGDNELGKMMMALMVGTGIGTALVEPGMEAGVGKMTRAGMESSIRLLVGASIGEKVAIRLAGKAGRGIGAGIGVVMIKKIRKKYFIRKIAANKISGDAQAEQR